MNYKIGIRGFGDAPSNRLLVLIDDIPLSHQPNIKNEFVSFTESKGLFKPVFVLKKHPMEWVSDTPFSDIVKRHHLDEISHYYYHDVEELDAFYISDDLESTMKFALKNPFQPLQDKYFPFPL